MISIRQHFVLKGVSQKVTRSSQLIWWPFDSPLPAETPPDSPQVDLLAFWLTPACWVHLLTHHKLIWWPFDSPQPAEYTSWLTTSWSGGLLTYPSLLSTPPDSPQADLVASRLTPACRDTSGLTSGWSVGILTHPCMLSTLPDSPQVDLVAFQLTPACWVHLPTHLKVIWWHFDSPLYAILLKAG